MVANTSYINPSARSWRCTDPQPDRTGIQRLHSSLPDFQPSPLVPLPKIAQELNLKAVFIKDESSRAGLPAFKILGASWGCFRAVVEYAGLPLSSSLDDVAQAATRLNLSLLAATEGNHGRAVARMGKLLNIPTRIFASNHMYAATRQNIANEGAEVVIVDGDYDHAVASAYTETQKTTGGILVQDNSFDGYEKVPRWIVEGYSTLLSEISDQQLPAAGFEAVTHVITPIGVGSLGHAVVAHCKSRPENITVISVEPETAACLHHSLRADKFTVIETSPTIMAGMHCATVSPISWPTLKAGVDVSVTINDMECHNAVLELRQLHGINAGPCGAASLVALRKVASGDVAAAGLDHNSVVVLLSTEGQRDYPVPE